MSRIVASIEARMKSSRLPGKVLADVCGQPALTRLLRRLRRCRSLDAIVLATTDDAADDVLVDWATSQALSHYRGSEDDVLLRLVEAHRMMQSEVVVEITGDCILLDPEIIDLGVDTFLANDCDVVTNARVPSYAIGLDVQVYRLKNLEEVERTVDDPAAREHVSLYFYENTERYRVIHMLAPARWYAPGHRFQLDYEEDLLFINEIYRRLEREHGDDFGVEEIMGVLRKEPWLADINIHCLEKSPR